MRINYTGDVGLARQGAAFGIEALLAIAMGAMMMGMMGQKQEEAPPPEPEKPQVMPDPNAKAIQDAADEEKLMLATSQDGRQGTNLSRGKSLGSNSSAPAATPAATDYTKSTLG